jgi:polysaccharide pyruvyl transferase WcaK-like protein
MRKIGILTTIEANHGSCAFNTSLNTLIRNLDSQNEVQFLEFLNLPTRFRETLRTFKINREIPFYNYQRYLTLNQETKENISIDRIINLHTTQGLYDDLNRRKYETLIVGKVIWDISDKAPLRFPNIYWLSEKIHAKKIAYAISGHRTNLDRFRQNQNQVYDLLRGFRLIGVRDKITQLMMEEAGIDKVLPVHRITDPAFLYQQNPVDVETLFKRYGIAKDRPLLGMLYYGKKAFSEKVLDHFHKKGYQIINFNMLNPSADLNIGHRVRTDEWIELIKQLDFCITDRFHVSVFCLRENIPFIAIEPYPPRSLLNSKIFSLLESFQVETTNYQNTYLEQFNIDQFLSVCDDLQENWRIEFSTKIQAQLASNNEQQRAFLKLVKQCIEE